MAWKLIFNEKALKMLKNLDKPTASRIINFLENRLSIADNPRTFGAALKGSALGDFWKYRVGEYRIITSIHDAEITIVVMKIGNRKDIYR